MKRSLPLVLVCLCLAGCRNSTTSPTSMTESMSVERHHVEEVHMTLDALYAAEKGDRSTLSEELAGKMVTVSKITVGSPAEIDAAKAVIKTIVEEQQAEIDTARVPLTEAEEVTRLAKERVDVFDDMLVLPNKRQRCGDDGCGGQCGQCDPRDFCFEDWCRNVPECAGKNCGEDAAGGLCGVCGEGKQCPESQVCGAPSTEAYCNPQCRYALKGDERGSTTSQGYPGRYRSNLHERYLDTPDAVDGVIAAGRARHALNQKHIDEHAARAVRIKAKEAEIETQRDNLKMTKGLIRELQVALRTLKRQPEVTPGEIAGQQTRLDEGKASINALKKAIKALQEEVRTLKALHRAQEPVVQACREAQPDLSSMDSRYTAQVTDWRAAIAAHQAAVAAQDEARKAFVAKVMEIKRAYAERLAEAKAAYEALETPVVPKEALATINPTTGIHGLLNTPVIEGAEPMLSAVEPALKSKQEALALVEEQREQWDGCVEEMKVVELDCAEPCAVVANDEDRAACKGCIEDELSSSCSEEAIAELPSKETLESYQETLSAQVDTLALVAPLIPALMASDERCRALRRAIVVERERYGAE